MLTESEIAAITTAWWEVDRLTTERPPGHTQLIDEVWWAWEAVEDKMSDASPHAVALLIALCDTAPTKDDLATVGAGPLWTLFFDNGKRMAMPEGKDLLVAVAAASRQKETFRIALGNVWNESDYLPESVWSSIPGLPPPIDQLPRPEPEPPQRRSVKARRPGRPPPTRRPPLIEE